MNIDKNIDINIASLEAELSGSADLVKRRIPVGKTKIPVYIAYIDMLVDRTVIEDQILRPLMLSRKHEAGLAIDYSDLFGSLRDGFVTASDISSARTVEEAADAILTGDTVLFIGGCAEAVIVSTKGWPNRGVPTVETEASVYGSKEAFSEVFRINTILLRRRIRDKQLSFYQTKVGRRSRTDVALAYIEGIARPKIVDDIKDRIANIDIDALSDSGALAELIEDDWLSPFPQAQLTERPDAAAAAVLEGRIAVIVDGSPFAILLPATLNVFFQSPDDYYQRFHISSLVRILRYTAAVIALALPGLYLSVAVFHPGMLPMLLIFKMAAARQSVPFPAFFEILLMEFAFELLREAGVRLPKPVGSSIGIIGGLIIGQAAVEAGLVSPIVVIVVAATGIAGFTVPNYSMLTGFRLTKYLITVLSALFGLFGFWMGIIILLIHLASLKSFGIPYLFPYSAGDVNNHNDIKDSIFRFPLFSMKKRPVFAEPGSNIRLRVKRTGNRKDKE